MDTPQIQEARAFVEAAELPVTSPWASYNEGSDPQFVDGRPQCAVVGSGAITFDSNVTAAQRVDIANACLLAQLVAKKQTPEPSDLAAVSAWYRSYFEALSKIGFVIGQTTFSRYQARSAEYSAHEAILEVATSALGGASGALKLVAKTLDALKTASENTPWITLFNRETRVTTTARVQVGAVESLPEGPTLTMLAFALEAKNVVTQVLLFKMRRNESTLEYSEGRFVANDAVLSAVRPQLATKLARYASDYIRALPDL